MSTYNVHWLRARIAEMLEYDSSEPDQAYGGTTADPWIRIDGWLNEAHSEILNEARLTVDQAHFYARYAFTWSSGETTYEFPQHVAQWRTEMIMDVTTHEVGEELLVTKSYRTGGMFWQDARTLHWGDTSGPAEDKNLQLVYMADAEEFRDGSQVPRLFPWRHRFLLVRKAALLARLDVDEDRVPASWGRRVQKLTQDYLLDLAQGRLRFTIPPKMGDTTVSDLY